MKVARFFYLTFLFLAFEINSKEKIVLQVPEKLGSANFFLRDGIIKYFEPNGNSFEPIANVIMYHGFGCEEVDMRCLQSMFKNCNIISFTFRAHGPKSFTRGQFCSLGKNEICEVKSSVDFVKNHKNLKNLPIIAYGFSMGAVSAIEAQAHFGNLFDAMILDAPFDSSEAVLLRGLERVKYTVLGVDLLHPIRKVLKKNVFNPLIQDALKFFLKAIARIDSAHINTAVCPVYPIKSSLKINVPTLVIGCVNDEKIPTKVFETIFNNINVPNRQKALWLTQGRKHFDSFFFNPDEYKKRVRDFIEKNFFKK